MLGEGFFLFPCSLLTGEENDADECSLPLLSQESGWKCRVKEVT